MLESSGLSFFLLAVIRCIQVRISQGHVQFSWSNPQVLGEARVSPLQLDIRTEPKAFPSCSLCLVLCWVQCSADPLPLSKSQEVHHFIFSSIPVSASVLQARNVLKGRAAKIAEQKGPELTSSYERTKITPTCRTTIDEKDWNLPGNIFYNKRQRRNHKMEPPVDS